MSSPTPFKPHFGTNQVVSPAAGALSITINETDKTVRVANTGTNKGYFRFGTAEQITAQAATVADCVVPGGAVVYAEKAEGDDTLSYISASGTTFEVMTGEGGVGSGN